jgi:hypothetical protein
VDLSPEYLHRHSRHTWSNDMAPLASSAFNALDWRLKAGEEGANAYPAKI